MALVASCRADSVRRPERLTNKMPTAAGKGEAYSGPMPPSENQQRCVMFVCAKRSGDDDEPSPVGTAFLVGVPDGQAGWHKYFVTAAHVVRGDSPRWIRLRRWDGGTPENVDVGEWVFHPTADLAATPCDFDTDEYIANYQEEEFFCDRFPPGAIVNMGERAYFMGLLSEIETLADSAVPMMRAAVVGAMNVENNATRLEAGHRMATRSDRCCRGREARPIGHWAETVPSAAHQMRHCRCPSSRGYGMHRMGRIQSDVPTQRKREQNYQPNRKPD
jgi:hypothetical protein